MKKEIRMELIRFGMLVVLVAGALVIAYASGQLTSYSVSDPFETYYSDLKMYSSVSELMGEKPVDNYVSVSGEVDRVLQDYTSKKGYQYQQFYITDGEEDLKIFCSKYKGAIDVKKGDQVSITGKFQLFGSEYEIYLDCVNVEVL